jgi:hypothetical protein
LQALAVHDRAMATRIEKATRREVPPHSAQPRAASPSVATAPGGDKRASKQDGSRTKPSERPIEDHHLLIPRGWMLMAPVMLGALALTALSSVSLPRVVPRQHQWHRFEVVI